MGTVYWPIFIKIVDVLEWARHGLALSVLWSIGQLGRNCKIHCVGSISADCPGSLLAFLQRRGEECLYTVGSTWYNSPLRRMNVRQWRKLFCCRALCALGSGACGNCQDCGSASQEATELQSSYVPPNNWQCCLSRWQLCDCCTWAVLVSHAQTNSPSCCLSLGIYTWLGNSSRWGSHQHSNQNPPGMS